MPSKSSNTAAGLLFDIPEWSLETPLMMASAGSRPIKHRKPKSKTCKAELSCPVVSTNADSQLKKPSAVPQKLAFASQSTTDAAGTRQIKHKKPKLKMQKGEVVCPTSPTNQHLEPRAGPEPLEAENENPATNMLAQNLLASKLGGSRFRILNETLYTSTGPQAAQLFSSELPSTAPNSNFVAYHQGFRQQTRNWPQNPVNVFAAALHTEFKACGAGETVMVADLGCGEAPLAKMLCGEKRAVTEEEEKVAGRCVKQQKKGPPGPVFRVMSYDLVADQAGWVIAAECSTMVPLPGCQADTVQNAAMDVVVCCLSLMGTNWVGMIVEARRILKQGGQLKIAEVTSRFVDVEKFVEFIKLIGFSNPIQDNSNTHFILFDFKKIVRRNPAQLKMNRLYDEPSELDHLIRRGERLLKPCVYKRR